MPPPERSEAERRAFRRFVLTHHPDRGGDPERFVTGLAQFRRSGSRPDDGASPRPARPPVRPNVVAHRRRPPLAVTLSGALRRVARRTPPRPPRVR